MPAASCRRAVGVLAAFLALGAAPFVSAGHAGAAVFVHARHGVFVSAGGWELVGSIAGALLAPAAAGPGRLSLAYVVRARPRRAPTAAIPPPAPAPAPAWEEAIPPPGLPVTPLIRLAPQPDRWQPAPSVFVEPERSGSARRPPAPVRHQ